MKKIALAAGLVLASTLAAQDIPLANWTVPPYHAEGAVATMTDVTPGVGFVGVAPCRLVDTREAGYPAGYGAPALSPGVQRSFDLNSDSLCPGIPAGVDAYSPNVTVTQTAGPGHLVIYPQGGSQPLVSSINYVAGQTTANTVIVPAGTGGGVTVVAGVSATHLIIDINGYFTDQYNAGVSFHAVSSNVAPAILGENTSTASAAVAIRGVITSTSPASSSAAVRGINNSTTGSGIGIWDPRRWWHRSRGRGAARRDRRAGNWLGHVSAELRSVGPECIQPGRQRGRLRYGWRTDVRVQRVLTSRGARG